MTQELMSAAQRIAALLGLLSLAACSAAPVQRGGETALTCQDPVHRQFDFWLGHWEVVQEDKDAPRAFNHIQRIARGCFLHEDYHSGTGFAGESINWYDAKWGQWRQTWADSNGLILHLAGGLDAQGRMVLYGGERKTREGLTIQDRITWQPEPGGTVRQIWDVSGDGGKKWRQIFSGLYVPYEQMSGQSGRGDSKRSLKP